MLSNQQDIPCSQISVHKIALFQIFHSHRHLMNQLYDVFILDMPESHTYVINDSERSAFQNNQPCFSYRENMNQLISYSSKARVTSGGDWYSAARIFNMCFELHEKQYYRVVRPGSWRTRVQLEPSFQYWKGKNSNLESHWSTNIGANGIK